MTANNKGTKNAAPAEIPRTQNGKGTNQNGGADESRAGRRGGDGKTGAPFLAGWGEMPLLRARDKKKELREKQPKPKVILPALQIKHQHEVNDKVPLHANAHPQVAVHGAVPRPFQGGNNNQAAVGRIGHDRSHSHQNA
jgi:hypothetical protein